MICAEGPMPTSSMRKMAREVIDWTVEMAQTLAGRTRGTRSAPVVLKRPAHKSVSSCRTDDIQEGRGQEPRPFLFSPCSQPTAYEVLQPHILHPASGRPRFHSISKNVCCRRVGS